MRLTLFWFLRMAVGCARYEVVPGCPGVTSPEREFPASPRGHTAGVNAVAMAPDGLAAASASDDGTVRPWRVSDGEPLGFADAVTYAVGGTVIVSAGADGRVMSWDRATGEQLEEGGDHAAPVHCVLTLP